MSQSKKISELNELNSGDIADNDEFVLNDSSEPETKKFTWSSLKESIDIQVQNYQAGDGLTLVNNETFSVNVSDLAGSGLQDDGSNNLELINDSITVAGNTVSLGGSTSINHNDLSNISTDDHHAKYQLTEDLTSGEITQLQNIDSVTITNTQWGYLGSMSGQPVESASELNHNDLSNISTDDHHTKYSLTEDLTSGEISQLQNIDSNTITNTQWGYLGDLDQNLTTTSDVNFAQLNLSSEANITGIEEEISNKNKKQVYLTNGSSNIFVNINSVWDGSSYNAAEGLGVGINALEYNTGVDSNGFGYAALQNNTGDYSNGFGYNALQNNTENYSNGFGYAALQNNIGRYSNGIGLYALQNNTGDYSNGFGHYTLRKNIGAHSNGFGNDALYNNTGDCSNGFGDSALRYNSFDGVIAIGNNALGGYNADTSNSKTVESVNTTDDQITITSHGFGSTGDILNLKMTTTDTLPSGVSEIAQWKVIDADTLELYDGDITDTGTGTHTIVPQYDITNSIAIGSDIYPTKPNQVVIGNADTEEYLLRGLLKIGSNYINNDGTSNEGLSFDASNNAMFTQNVDIKDATLSYSNGRLYLTNDTTARAIDRTSDAKTTKTTVENTT